MPEINITINVGSADNSVILTKLNQMSEQFDQLKAKLEALSPQIDTITTGVQTANTSLTGVTDDLTYLKELLANNPTPEQITEATILVDNLTAKVTPAAEALTALGTSLAALDAQTTRT